MIVGDDEPESTNQLLGCVVATALAVRALLWVALMLAAIYWLVSNA